MAEYARSAPGCSASHSSPVAALDAAGSRGVSRVQGLRLSQMPEKLDLTLAELDALLPDLAEDVLGA